jgi:hypothetical protein
MKYVIYFILFCLVFDCGWWAKEWVGGHKDGSEMCLANLYLQEISESRKGFRAQPFVNNVNGCYGAPMFSVNDPDGVIK